MDSFSLGPSPTDPDHVVREPRSATEDGERRSHRLRSSSRHHHTRSRSRSRGRHHHHHHHRHHRHHRHGQVRNDLDEDDRRMLREPQTARPSDADLQGTLEDLTRGPRTAPMNDMLQVPHSSRLQSRQVMPSSPQLPSRSETPAPTYQTNPPSEASIPIKNSSPATSSARPHIAHSQSLPSKMTVQPGASPRTLAYVEEQRRILQQPAPALAGPTDLPQRGVHFVPSRSNTASSRAQQQISPAPVPSRADRNASYQHAHVRDSYSTMHDELSQRDRRFSNMVEDCFRDSKMYSQLFSKNAVRNTAQSGDLRRRQNKRISLVDSIMGFDEMTPQDLVYGEGSKVDGGFGFALPSRYREGTVLLDSGPARFSIDSSGTGSSDSESTGSYSSTLSNMFGRGSVQKSQPPSANVRESKESFFRRSKQPHTLADRVSTANSRPPPLNLNKNSMSKPLPPSRLRESSSIVDRSSEPDDKGFEEVKLDTDGKTYSKNDRLADALGVRKPERTMTRDDSDSTMVGSVDGSSDEKSGKYEQEPGRVSKFHSKYSKDDEHGGHRSSMNLPQGMSQADIVAICLVQGMVPPGLPPDPTLVTWSTPLSPTNPRNWSPFHKWYACILVSMATFLANAGTNMLAPALGLISKSYHEIYTPAIRGLLIGCYVLAFAFAPLIFGPMSEVMGRKPVLLMGCGMFFVFTLASGFVNSSYLMMFFRFLTALGASAPMSIGGAVITDIFPPEQRGSAMTVFALAPQLGPVLGPILGGWVTQEIQNWRWIFYIKAIAVGIFCFPIIFVKESYTPRILRQRADRLRKETGNQQLSTIFERRKESVAQVFTRGAIRPLVLFGSEPIIQMICVYVSVIYGVIHLLVATFPAVMGTIYAEYPGWASMHFITIGVGTITGGIAGGFLTEFHYKRLTKRNGGIARPEFKLYSLLYITWLAPIGLLGYFFITYWGIHWIFADAAIVLFCIGISAAVVSLQSYIVDCFSLLAGSALTSTIVVRSFFGFGATVAAEDLLLRGGLFWSGVSLSTLCTVTCVPIVYIVYYRGAHLRSKSKYATHKR